MSAQWRSIQSLGELFPDVHAQALSSYFPQGEPDSDDWKAFDAVLERLSGVFILGFTNRCGSHFVGQAIASDRRVKPAGEGLNSDLVIKQSENNGFKNYLSYFSWLLDRQRGKSGISSVKASVGQLVWLYNYGILQRIGPKLKVIHLERENVAAQAVSLLIASSTKKWTSSQVGIEDVEVEYHPDRILKIISSINQQNACFRSLFHIFGMKVLDVQYENFLSDPVAQTRRAGRFLGLKALKYVPEAVRVEKQADDRNQALLDALAADFCFAKGWGDSTSGGAVNHGDAV